MSLLLLAREAPAAALAGIDPSPVMVRMARRRAARLASKPDLRQGTAAALPWPDGAFDAVCATNSGQLWQPLPASLGEARRVLRAGGRLVLGVHQRAVLPAGGTAGRQPCGRQPGGCVRSGGGISARCSGVTMSGTG